MSLNNDIIQKIASYGTFNPSLAIASRCFKEPLESSRETLFTSMQQAYFEDRFSLQQHLIPQQYRRRLEAVFLQEALHPNDTPPHNCLIAEARKARDTWNSLFSDFANLPASERIVRSIFQAFQYFGSVTKNPTLEGFQRLLEQNQKNAISALPFQKLPKSRLLSVEALKEFAIHYLENTSLEAREDKLFYQFMQLLSRLDHLDTLSDESIEARLLVFSLLNVPSVVAETLQRINPENPIVSSAFLVGIKGNYIDVVKAFCERFGQDPHFHVGEAIAEAANCGNPEMVALLLHLPFSPIEIKAALENAIIAKNKSLSAMLFQSFMPFLNVESAKEIFLEASKSGQLEIAKDLFSKFPNELEMVTALQMAHYKNEDGIVQFLLEQGISIPTEKTSLLENIYLRASLNKNPPLLKILFRNYREVISSSDAIKRCSLANDLPYAIENDEELFDLERGLLSSEQRFAWQCLFHLPKASLQMSQKLCEILRREPLTLFFLPASLAHLFYLGRDEATLLSNLFENPLTQENALNPTFISNNRELFDLTKSLLDAAKRGDLDTARTLFHPLQNCYELACGSLVLCMTNRPFFPLDNYAESDPIKWIIRLALKEGHKEFVNELIITFPETNLSNLFLDLALEGNTKEAILLSQLCPDQIHRTDFITSL